MSIFFTYNDKIYKEGTGIISPDNRSFRYGDGLFETLKVHKGIIQLGSYHFDRLFSGMETLQFEIPQNFTVTFLEEKIAEMCKKNQHNFFSRVRLMVFRGNGGLYDTENHDPNYIIQTWDIENAGSLNYNGLIIDIYQDAKKTCDKFSNLKSNNFLPYTMAALYAKKKKVNDCILLNTFGRICDSTIANVFIIKNDIIYTPPLSEGCIAGVIRRFVIETLQQSEYIIKEKAISVEELESADEIFLTNSIRGISWVKQFRDKTYTNHKVKEINAFITPQLI